MFRTKVNDHIIKIRFSYQYTTNTPDNKFKNAPIVTIASAYNNNEILIGKGVAICSIKEKICSKKIGRKIALTRLIKFLYPTNKDNRSIIWKAYFGYIERGIRL